MIKYSPNTHTHYMKKVLTCWIENKCEVHIDHMCIYYNACYDSYYTIIIKH